MTLHSQTLAVTLQYLIIKVYDKTSKMFGNMGMQGGQQHSILLC